MFRVFLKQDKGVVFISGDLLGSDVVEIAGKAKKVTELFANLTGN